MSRVLRRGQHRQQHADDARHLEGPDHPPALLHREMLHLLQQRRTPVEDREAQDVDEEVGEGFEAGAKTGSTFKTSKGGTVTKTATGIKHERDPNSYDDGGDELDSMAKSGKGIKSHAKAKSAAEKKAEAPKVEPKKEETKKVETPKNVAVENIWLYHKDFEPKMFKKGEVIPEGWEFENKHKWFKDPKNNFSWRK